MPVSENHNGATLGTVELTAEESRRAAANLAVALLFVTGLLLVLCAEWLGRLWVQHCGPSGGCTWYSEEAHAAASTFRSLGVMVFIVGVAERVILVVRGLRQPPA